MKHVVGLSWMVVETDLEEKKSLNQVIVFVFLAGKKYSCGFIKLRLNH